MGMGFTKQIDLSQMMMGFGRSIIGTMMSEI